MTFEEIARANAGIRTLSIKGKNYAPVTERIKAFRSLCPDGSIETELLEDADGRCVFKATVRDGETVLGVGHAFEKEESSFINKTSYIENCVPLDTQILTNQGWKYYFQLKDGQSVLSLNMSTGKVEYCKLLAINRYIAAPLKRLKTSRFDAVCTAQHKWVVDSQYASPQKVATSELKVSQRILQNVPQYVEPSEIGKKLGWLMCDCEINKTQNGLPSTAYIRQSKHVDEVAALFGKGRQVLKFNEKWLDSYEWVICAEEARKILGHFGMADYRDLPAAMAKAELKDVRGAYESMMLADGSERGFSSTYSVLIEAMQIMCARLGIATSFVTSRMCQKSTKPIYTLGIKKTSKTCVSELNITSVPPQDVWCPTTENGTWFMRQGSFVTLTSNCETSAVGRALGMAGFGTDESLASYEELSNALKNQEKEKPKGPMCSECGREILPATNANGKMWTAEKIAKTTTEKYGRALCCGCARALHPSER